MRAKFEKRANKLQDDCLQALSDNRNKFAEKIDGFGYCTGYYLSENHNYDAFVFVQGKWQLKQGEYLYCVYSLPVEVLCSYVDYVISKYKFQ